MPKTENMVPIDCFDGEYRFLSNFYPAEITYEDLVYANNEAAFQAQKTLNMTERRRFALPACKNPSEAKRMGRRVALRADWNDIRIRIMREVCLAKFTQHPELAAKLIATGDRPLIEGNTWHDTFWGVCNGHGENHLGQILMEIRELLANGPENPVPDRQ